MGRRGTWLGGKLRDGESKHATPPRARAQMCVQFGIIQYSLGSFQSIPDQATFMHINKRQVIKIVTSGLQKSYNDRCKVLRSHKLARINFKLTQEDANKILLLQIPVLIISQ